MIAELVDAIEANITAMLGWVFLYWLLLGIGIAALVWGIRAARRETP